jgi:glycosyltransferase involved in cell wall biosynthesis
VLQVIQNLNYGGMERVLADIVRRLDTSRFELHVLCLQFLGRFSQGLDTIAELHVGRPSSRLSMLWPRTLSEDLRRIAPDVVHSHGGVWYKASLAARLAGVRRVIHTEHGRIRPDPWTHRLLDGMAARRTDVVVAVSGELSTELRQSLRVPASRIVVIPNGVDTDLHRPSPDTGALRHSLGVGPTVAILGSVGRLEVVKGYGVMLQAFALLQREWRGGPSPILVIGGEGSERSRLQELAGSLGLGGSVHLLGWRDDIADLHAAFTLFTMASRSEGTSVSLLEAMSAGLCPVVTDVGGNGAVLGSTLRHRVVPPDDPGALATAWLDALHNPARRRDDAQLARERVCQVYGLEGMVRAYAAIYGG